MDTSHSLTELDKAMSLAKVRLMTSPNAVFFSAVCMQLKHEWDTNIETACTNGLRIKYNPDFFMRFSLAQRVGLMLHEVLHVALFHPGRLGNRAPQKWNVAADYAINIIIVDAEFELPDGGLLDVRYRDMSAEQIYALLPEDPDEELKPDMDDLEPAEVGSEGAASMEEVQAQIDNILVQAVLQAEAANAPPGSVPGDLARYVEKLLNPIVPWHRVLSSYVNKRAKTSTSFKRPNRRFFPDNILPSRHALNLCDITLGVDVSGSTTDAAFDHYVTEAMRILYAMKPKKLTFIQFDTTLKPVVELSTRDSFGKIEFTGRGGTHIDPLMEWAAEHKPAILLVFTDGGFRAPKTNPKVPVIWIIDSNPNFTAPFGKVIHYNFSDL